MQNFINTFVSNRCRNKYKGAKEMKISKIKSGAGSYRLVKETTYNHMISTIDDFNEQRQHPLLAMLIELAEESEEVELEEDDND
jgi:ATP-dependent exoDNAse (exonuclease V) beta subunit